MTQNTGTIEHVSHQTLIERVYDLQSLLTAKVAKWVVTYYPLEPMRVAKVIVERHITTDDSSPSDVLATFTMSMHDIRVLQALVMYDKRQTPVRFYLHEGSMEYEQTNRLKNMFQQ